MPERDGKTIHDVKDMLLKGLEASSKNGTLGTETLLPRCVVEAPCLEQVREHWYDRRSRVLCR